MIRQLGVVTALVSLAALSGCASIASDNDTTTYIHTMPEAARCDLAGEEFERTVNTPSSIMIPSKAAPVSLNCSADGYKTGTATLDTSVDGWIFGNILLGGVIGAVIDASRGAGMRYPEEIEIVLEPEMFATIAERDGFFDAWRVKTEAKWTGLIDTLETRCGSGPEMEPAECEMRMEKLQSKRSAELAIIEGKRNSAVVETDQPLTLRDAAPL